MIRAWVHVDDDPVFSERLASLPEAGEHLGVGGETLRVVRVLSERSVESDAIDVYLTRHEQPA